MIISLLDKRRKWSSSEYLCVSTRIILSLVPMLSTCCCDLSTKTSQPIRESFLHTASNHCDHLAAAAFHKLSIIVHVLTHYCNMKLHPKHRTPCKMLIIQRHSLFKSAADNLIESFPTKTIQHGQKLSQLRYTPSRLLRQCKTVNDNDKIVECNSDKCENSKSPYGMGVWRVAAADHHCGLCQWHSNGQPPINIDTNQLWSEVFIRERCDVRLRTINSLSRGTANRQVSFILANRTAMEIVYGVSMQIIFIYLLFCLSVFDAQSGFPHISSLANFADKWNWILLLMMATLDVCVRLCCGGWPGGILRYDLYLLKLKLVASGRQISLSLNRERALFAIFFSRVLNMFSFYFILIDRWMMMILATQFLVISSVKSTDLLLLCLYDVR